jgi:hypothetical protein
VPMKRTALALRLIMAFVLVCTLWIMPIRTVQSQSFNTIYIRADGSVEGTELIEIQDDTYIFLNDISGSIVVSKDFITIDGSGYTLMGTDDSSQRGISLSNRKNITVTNLVIMNYYIGISCGGTSSNITILNNYVGGCGIGIEFLGSSDHLIKFNTFENNDIDVAINYVSGNNLITITYNNLNDYVQLWMSEQQTIDLNYWADYDGSDSDGDEIGDSPYFYNEILQDYHPLISPLAIPVLPETSPTPEPTPTSSPYNGPQPSEFEVILGVVFIVVIIGAGLGLLLYLIKRK